MSTPTTRLSLNKPAGNEVFTRAVFTAILDAIDAAVEKKTDGDTRKSEILNHKRVTSMGGII